MKELLAAVEGKQMLRTLTFNDCLSAICIEKTLDVDAHTLENCYKTRLQNIQLDNASENDKIVILRLNAVVNEFPLKVFSFNSPAQRESLLYMGGCWHYTLKEKFADKVKQSNTRPRL